MSLRGVSRFDCNNGSFPNLTRSAAPSPVFRDGVRKRGSGSTLSKPWPSGRGVEGLTSKAEADDVSGLDH
jgi:hypothetical protein